MALDPGRGRGDTVIGRLTSETKQAFKTTEFFAYVLAVAGVLIASAMIGEDDSGGGGNNAGDVFTADEAWRYVTFLTIGSMVARGLAKAGSRDPYWATTDDLPGARNRGDDRS